jgi:hypothetical protein
VDILCILKQSFVLVEVKMKVQGQLKMETRFLVELQSTMRWRYLTCHSQTKEVTLAGDIPAEGIPAFIPIEGILDFTPVSTQDRR